MPLAAQEAKPAAEKAASSVGVVVVEYVFTYPGMGKLLIDSINRLDRPFIVAYLMLTVLIFVVINLAVDLLYAAIDPRVRLADAKG